MTKSHQLHSMLCSARVAFIVASCIVMIACSFWCEVGNASAQEGLSVTASFDANTPLTPDTPIELRLNHALKTVEGHITIIIGHVDVTSLFISDGTRFVYSSTFMPLPLGAVQVIVYRVQANGAWFELARFP